MPVANAELQLAVSGVALAARPTYTLRTRLATKGAIAISLEILR
jgi:hypothetical protein